MFRAHLRAVGARLLRDEGGLTAFVRDHRLLFTLLYFGVLSAISVTASFLLRFVVFESVLPAVLSQWQVWWLAMLAVTVPLRLLFFWLTGVHRQSWRFASIEDLPPLILSVFPAAPWSSCPCGPSGANPAGSRFRPWPSTWSFASAWSRAGASPTG